MYTSPRSVTPPESAEAEETEQTPSQEMMSVPSRSRSSPDTLPEADRGEIVVYSLGKVLFSRLSSSDILHSVPSDAESSKGSSVSSVESIPERILAERDIRRGPVALAPMLSSAVRTVMPSADRASASCPDSDSFAVYSLFMGNEHSVPSSPT